jgi:hypothetical protein
MSDRADYALITPQPEKETAAEAAEEKADSRNQSTKAFLDELYSYNAKDHAGLVRMASSSKDGYPCYIYKTKSDCDWHPPCHWNTASKHCG